MLSVPVVNMQGESQGEIPVDPARFGGRVRHVLIKQAIVAYLDHQRQRSARTKGRSDVEGSTRKLYRQKGTGRARAGNLRTPLRKGGGRTFARRVPGRVQTLPKKMRRLALDSAILAKIQTGEVVVVDDFACPQVKTKIIAGMLSAIGADRGCVLATPQREEAVYLSGRNIPMVDVRPVDELTAYEVLRRRRLVLTRPAFERLVEGGRPGLTAVEG